MGAVRDWQPSLEITFFTGTYLIHRLQCAFVRYIGINFDAVLFTSTSGEHKKRKGNAQGLSRMHIFVDHEGMLPSI